MRKTFLSLSFVVGTLCFAFQEAPATAVVNEGHFLKEAVSSPSHSLSLAGGETGERVE